MGFRAEVVEPGRDDIWRDPDAGLSAENGDVPCRSLAADPRHRRGAEDHPRRRHHIRGGAAMNPELIAVLMFSLLLLGLFMGHPLALVLGGTAVLTAVIAGKTMVLGIVINRIFGDVLDN